MLLRPDPVLSDRDILVLLGLRGMGKTSCAFEVLGLQPGRKAAWDPHDEYCPDGDEGKPESPLRDRIIFDGSREAIAELVAKLDEPELSLAVVPDCGGDDPMQKLSELFVVAAKYIETAGEMTFNIDECGMLEGRAQSRLSWMASQSRHWQMPLVLAAQRAVQMSVTAREQATWRISYRQQRPEDVEALLSRIATDATPQTIEAFRNLPRADAHERAEWWAGSGRKHATRDHRSKTK